MSPEARRRALTRVGGVPIAVRAGAPPPAVLKDQPDDYATLPREPQKEPKKKRLAGVGAIVFWLLITLVGAFLEDDSSDDEEFDDDITVEEDDVTVEEPAFTPSFAVGEVENLPGVYETTVIKAEVHSDDGKDYLVVDVRIRNVSEDTQPNGPESWSITYPNGDLHFTRRDGTSLESADLPSGQEIEGKVAFDLQGSGEYILVFDSFEFDEEDPTWTIFL